MALARIRFMHFVCRTCGVVEAVEGESLRDASEVVCDACGAAMSRDLAPAIRRPVHTQGLDTTGLVPEWFVLIEQAQAGPYGAAHVADLLEAGEIVWTSLVWRQGLKDWRPARRDDVLVTAVACVRGMGSDTSRIDAFDTVHCGGDTIVAQGLGVFSELEDAEPGHGQTSAVLGPLDDPGLITRRSVPPASSNEALVRRPLSSARPLPGGDGLRARLLARLPWLSRHATPVIAALAFCAGGLVTTLVRQQLGPAASEAERALASGEPNAEVSGGVAASAVRALGERPDEAFAQAEALRAADAGEVAPEASDAAVQAEAVPADAAAQIGDGAVSAASAVQVPAAHVGAPDARLLNAELQRLGPKVRRCLRRVSSVALEFELDGRTGRVTDLGIAGPPPRATRGACVIRVMQQLQVEPFSDRTLRMRHAYAW